MLAGIVLALLVLEAGLRLSGFVVLKAQELSNRGKLKKIGTYRILCIGESTTSGQYPGFLQDILNSEGSPIRFTVIDCGRGATNTSVLLKELPGNVDRYRPDMVVAMMGINDIGYNMVCDRHSFFSELKVYKLFRLMKMHATGRFETVKTVKYRELRGRSRKVYPLGKTDREKLIVTRCNEIAERDDAVRGETELQRLIADNPDFAVPYIDLARLYTREGKYDASTETIQKIKMEYLKDNDDCLRLAEYYREFANYAVDPQENYRMREQRLTELARRRPELMDDHRIVLGLGILYKYQKKYAEAERVYRQALAIGGEDVDTYIKLAEVCRLQGKYKETELIFRRAMDLDPDDSYLNGVMGAFYLEQGDIDRAEKCLGKVEGSRREFCKLVTHDNYRKMIEYVTARGIKMICMQYPMRSVAPLKDMVATGSAVDGLTFVDNETVFRDAVRREGYNALFRDSFAGDFGHCTDRGNRLLAENLADTVLKVCPAR
jgi:tetratricopeptide (TPR) repeat protein